MSESYEREVKGFLGRGGPLSSLIEGFEVRPEQVKMAGAVLRSLAEDSLLFAEAGTGTGKTLAYLVPALYSERRVVISTGTKALQEQLMFKDLPVLSREFEVNAVLMKGRANYLCWKRFHDFNRAPAFHFRDEISHFNTIQEWASRTKTGDRAEVPGLPDEYPTWREISATSEQCLGQKCEHFQECFVTRMRAMAQQADIVVVNHHLFFADLAVRSDAPGQVIPSYETVIFDEAHSLPEIATEYFGLRFSNFQLLDLAQDIRRLQRLGKVALDDLKAMLRTLEKAEHSAGELLKHIGGSLKSSGGNQELSRYSLAPVLKQAAVQEWGDKASADLKSLSAALNGLAKNDESIKSLSERAGNLAGELKSIVSGSDPDQIYWAEIRGKNVFLRASPAELGPILEPRLLSNNLPIIFTSATLAVVAQGKWSFDHYRKALGAENLSRKTEEMCLPSSYNWKENSILYIPRDLPEPMDPAFVDKAAKEMESILHVSKGRAFLLFTSYRNMERAYELLYDKLPYTVFKQGDAPKGELLEEFRADENSVLFATQSFWAGVDVSGPALSCVVVDKLPFASPSDPLVAEKVARIKKQQRNAFMEFQLPSAVLSLKQGLGRLIRGRNDYGILAVLDSRIIKKRYGRIFLESLPPVPVSHDLRDLESFMERHEGAPEPKVSN
ncbi:MAG: ATP-dependent DNA helicase [bacterium]